MSLCDLNCCDLKYLQTKFDAINKKISDNQKIQDKINANIFNLLKEVGIDIEENLKNYYALNEDDYTKTLTSEDDINTLEPGTYKIVKTDMPQNAPTGIASTEYDGTLIQSNSYAILFENDFDVCYRTKTSDETWTEWERVAFMSDLPSLTGYATQEWVNQQIQDITGGSVTADWVKRNYYALTYSQYTRITSMTDYTTLEPGSYLGHSSNFTNKELSLLKGNLLIIKFNSSFSTYRAIIYNFTNNRFYFYDSTETQVKKIAYTADIPNLSNYATKVWVQSQNYLTEIPDEYATDAEVSQAIAAALVGYATQAWVNSQGFAKEADIPSLNGYATQSWVNSQGFLTEIPDEYITLTELQSQNYATQSWVTGKGYQTSTQVDAAVTEALNGYATQTWVNQQNFAHESDMPNLSDYATQSWVNSQNFATEEWVGQQGYQTVQQVNSLINTATADMLTQEDLDTLNYATENWVLQTALNEYATTDDVTNATSKNNILKYQLDHSYFNLITENTDLNTLSIGVYSSDSSAISATLLNKPQTLTRGFKLTMSEIVGPGYYSQTIIENITGKIFIRCSENNKWNEWREI